MALSLSPSTLDASGAAVPALETLTNPTFESGPGDIGSFLLPGREEDARVADIAFRLAVSGLPRCSGPTPLLGIVFQHLTQFKLIDRPGMIAALGLDRGPAAIAVVSAGPAGQAGMHAGDVLVAINGEQLPPEIGADAPFSTAQAHARADLIEDLLMQARARPVVLSVLRKGVEHTLRIDPTYGCPSQVYLARSEQRNAYADGRHVFVTTGLLGKLRNNDELAFLIAHEMAHNILGHAAIMRGPDVKRGVGRTLGRSGDMIRGLERAADRLGAQLMLDAGFDPLKGADVLRRLNGGNLGIALFQEHDPTAIRIATIRTLVQGSSGAH